MNYYLYCIFIIIFNNNNNWNTTNNKMAGYFFVVALAGPGKTKEKQRALNSIGPDQLTSTILSEVAVPPLRSARYN